jgi:hypothetical protein
VVLACWQDGLVLEKWQMYLICHTCLTNFTFF